jgi:ABC-type Na+ efflux pump permease subunit
MSSHHIRWKGRVTGPHTLEDIQGLLAAGEISRMHQIDHAGQWQSLDEFLRDADGTRQAEAAANAQEEELERRRVAREEANDRLRAAALEQHFAWLQHSQSGHPKERPEARKERTSNLAVAAFVVSFCSFIPFVNIVSWIPALILAHAALAEIEKNPKLNGRALAQGAIVISCTFLVLGVLFLLGLVFGVLKW